MSSGFSPLNMATIIQAEVIEHGDAIAVMLKERDGTISAIRISVEQLAD
jgi:hypothetical protein